MLSSNFQSFLFDPLEQFLVIPFYFKLICPTVLTNVTIILLLVIFTLKVFVFVPKFFKKKRHHSVVEWIFFHLSLVLTEDYLAHNKHQNFFPIIYFVFVLILWLNFCGLIPYSYTVTSMLIVTLATSLMLQGGIITLGVYFNRLKFLNLFLPSGTPFIITPFLVVIEIVSYLARLLSLAIRLFVNMMAGHTLMKILIGFAWTALSFGAVTSLYSIFPILIFLIITCLETLISFLQAYIFTVLFILYTNDAINLH